MPDTRVGESGFSLIELLVAMGLLMTITAIVTSALTQLTQSQTTIWNRTEMHSGIRGATELLQQEVGQAGRISLPAEVTLNTNVTGVLPCAATTTVNVSSTDGMFVGERLSILDGDTAETVEVTAIPSATQMTACFTQTHVSGAKVAAMGGFATGIVPDDMTDGSSASVLKMYGDINDDGNMVYVEYTCDTTVGKLYRRVMAFDAASKPAVSDADILLGNILPNPGGHPCFEYQEQTISPYTYVLDVAITLTVQTEQVDPVTRQYQTETKALLNVSPRNVFNTWAMSAGNFDDRIQPMPSSVVALLPEAAN